MDDLQSFSDCLAKAQGKRHLLLGNGFSRACRNNIFSYDSLFDAADFQDLSGAAKEAFNKLGTTDFELVMRGMQTAASLVRLYSGEETHSLATTLEEDADKLRALLVTTIAGHHPEMPSQIDDSEYSACLEFLGHFDKIYTLNYDLLLYWTCMKGRELETRRDDGFRDPYFGEPEGYFEEGFVEWTNSSNLQNVHYLHGALHLFYQGGSLQKYCWSRTGIRLLDQIDDSLKKGRFPLIVAEGGTDQKFERIQRSNYLGHNYRSLGKITGSLFVYGHSLAENDRHILQQIRKNTSLQNLFVSIYGDLNHPANKAIVEAANALSTGRPAKKPLNVEFYNAGSARVWGR